MTRTSPSFASWCLVVFQAVAGIMTCGCGQGSRPDKSHLDAGDSDSQDSDTGTGDLPDLVFTAGWGSAPGYRMTWAVGAGGPYNGDIVGDIAFSVSFSPEGDLFFGGRTLSDDIVFGLGTTNELWFDGFEDGRIYVARYTGAGVPMWVSFVDTEIVEVQKVLSLEDGSVVATGIVANFGAPAIFGAGEPGETSVDTEHDRFFLARYRADGTLDWVRHSRGGDVTWAHGLARTTNGDYCVGAKYQDHALLDDGTLEGIVLDNDDDSEGFVARFDENGLARWARPVRTFGRGSIKAAAALPDGSCAFAGYFEQWVAVPDGPDQEVLFEAEMQGDWSHFVARYDAEGNLIWFEDLGIAALAGGLWGIDSSPMGLAALGSDIAVSGIFTGDMLAGTEQEPVLVNAGPDPDDRGLYLARLGGEDGGRAWTKTALGETEHSYPYDSAAALEALPDGGLVLGGSFTGKKTFGVGEEHETELAAVGDNSDAFLAVYEEDGTLRWVSRLVSCHSLMQGTAIESGEVIVGLSVDEQGSIAASGWFLGRSTFGTGPADAVEMMSLGSYDAFVLRLDPEGPIPSAR